MEIYNDNCFNIFPKLQPKSIDLILVDLPYNCTSCHWDSAIDLDKMWIELKRICKKKCLYVFFCTTKFGYTLIKSNPKWYKSDLVWYKSKKVGFLNSGKAVLRQHEMIYIFGNYNQRNADNSIPTYNPQKTAGLSYKIKRKENVENVYGKIKLPKESTYTDRHPTKHEMIYLFGNYNQRKSDNSIATYNPQKTVGKPYKTKGSSSESYYREEGIKYNFTAKDNKGDRCPTSVLKFKNPSKSVHKTQKPVDLIEWLIKSYSNEGDLVMDFTMGSGSTYWCSM